MKSILFVIAISTLLASTACNSSSASNAATKNDSLFHQHDTANFTNAAWTDSVQNFGDVQKGNLVKIVFHVKNTGTHPLFITSASPSCGCTIASYTKSAIATGESGEVTATFDSNHGSGDVHKSIAVVSNTNPPRKTLVFEGHVEEAKK